MTKEEREDVNARINNEGFDYTFMHYSHFEEIKDTRFHKLREQYIKAIKDLRDYIGYEED